MLYDVFKRNEEANIVEQYKEESQSKAIWKNWLYTKRETNKSLKLINTYDEYFKIQEEEKAKHGDLYRYNYSRYAIEYLGDFEDNLKTIIRFLIANITYKKHIICLKELEKNLERFGEEVVNDWISVGETYKQYGLTEKEAEEMEENYQLQVDFMMRYLEKVTKKVVKIVEENNVLIFK